MSKHLIIHVITGLNTGGAEMMLFKVLERLDRQRFSPHVISLTSLGELAPRIAALGIPSFRAPKKPGKFLWSAAMQRKNGGCAQWV